MRLVNLLTAARLYVDQLGHHATEILPEISTIKDDVKRLFANEYDNNPEYRFMEALRNYVQHRGIPVHSTQYSASREGEGGEERLVFTTEVFSNKNDLKEDGLFKKAVLKEIPEKVDLKVATRAYVECLSKVHCSVRQMVDQKLKESRQIIDNLINTYKQSHSGELIGLHVEWDEIRLKLQKRNLGLVNLRKRHVTGRAKSS